MLKEDFHARNPGSSVGASSKDSSGDDGDGEPNALQYLFINERHFEYAFNHVIPSVSKKDQA